jgi:hypothetical protein
VTLSLEMKKLRESLSCVTFDGGSQDSCIVIKELDSKASLKKVTLVLPTNHTDWLSFDPDNKRGKSKVMSPLLSTKPSNPGHHCACDCVVVLNQGTQLTVIYIDLKSGHPTGYEKQFQSTRQFMRYALGLLEEFHQIKLCIKNERYVILFGGKKVSINKQKTTATKPSKSKPDAAHKLEIRNDATLYLKAFLD